MDEQNLEDVMGQLIENALSEARPFAEQLAKRVGCETVRDLGLLLTNTPLRSRGEMAGMSVQVAGIAAITLLYGNPLGIRRFELVRQDPYDWLVGLTEKGIPKVSIFAGYFTLDLNDGRQEYVCCAAVYQMVPKGSALKSGSPEPLIVYPCMLPEIPSIKPTSGFSLS